MRFRFDIQRFGGGGGSTTQTYEPSEYELQLQDAQAQYAKAIAPNAYWLNDVARSLLENSLGTVQVDFNALNNEAQKAYNDGMNQLRQIVQNNGEALATTSGRLNDLYTQIPSYVDSYIQRTNGIGEGNTEATNRYNEQLASLLPLYGKTAQAGIDAANQTNAKLEGLANRTSELYDKYGDVRDGLIQGRLPSEYQDNITNAIRSALDTAMGQTLNDAANKGVINSSVSGKALKDIADSGAAAAAQRYLDSINTIGGLLTSGTSDSLNLLGAQGNLYGQQYANVGNALDRNLASLGAQGQLTQQQLGNIQADNQFQLDIANNQFQNRLQGNTAQSNLLGQYMGNSLQTNAQNAGIAGNLIGNASGGIAAAAAAQEAAQAPASRAWNMSLGLNNSNTGALAAAAGKGTTTTTQSGGGGLFSGLLGGLF